METVDNEDEVELAELGTNMVGLVSSPSQENNDHETEWPKVASAINYHLS